MVSKVGPSLSREDAWRVWLVASQFSSAVSAANSLMAEWTALSHEERARYAFSVIASCAAAAPDLHAIEQQNTTDTAGFALWWSEQTGGGA